MDIMINSNRGKVKLPGRLRAIASDVERGATKGGAWMLRHVAAVLEEEEDALAELKAAAVWWRNSRGGRDAQRAEECLTAALERLERTEAQR